jgi:hypothetical protein
MRGAHNEPRSSTKDENNWRLNLTNGVTRQHPLDAYSGATHAIRHSGPVECEYASSQDSNGAEYSYSSEFCRGRSLDRDRDPIMLLLS